MPCIRRDARETGGTPVNAAAYNRVLAEFLAAWEVPEAQARRTLSAIRKVRVTAQGNVFTQGEPSAGMWMLLDGSAHTYHTTQDGRERAIVFHDPLASLDLVAAIDGGPHDLSARARETSLFALWPRQDFLEVFRYPKAHDLFLRLLCLEVRRRDISVGTASLKHAEDRVRCAILQLARRFGVPEPSGKVLIDFRITRQDLADTVGIRLESAIRAMADLTAEGIISTRQQRISIDDPVRLRASADCEHCTLDCNVLGMLRLAREAEMRKA